MKMLRLSVEPSAGRCVEEHFIQSGRPGALCCLRPTEGSLLTLSADADKKDQI